jgi:hypothetical protein
MVVKQPTAKKKRPARRVPNASTGLLAEYKRSDFPRGFVRGKYAARAAEGTNIVRLDPEIAAAFPTSAAVNQALGRVLRAARSAKLAKQPNGRTKGKAASPT